jgi:hypothetical protein
MTSCYCILCVSRGLDVVYGCFTSVRPFLARILTRERAFFRLMCTVHDVYAWDQLVPIGMPHCPSTEQSNVEALGKLPIFPGV